MSALRLVAAWLLIGAAAACSEESVAPAPQPPPRVVSWEGELSCELRGTAKTKIELPKGDRATFTIELTGFDLGGLFDAAAPLVADGTVEALPEAAAELFGATLELPASPSGACGKAPVTLALALVRRTDAFRFGGGLTAYCGTHAAGVPAKVLRLTGTMTPRFDR